MTTLITVNENEYGIACVFSTAYDMSGFSSVSMQFIKPDGTILLVSSPDVTVPVVDLVTVLGTFLANTYTQYIFQDGDLDQTGVWSCRVIYDETTPLHLISNSSTFTVTP